MPRSTETDHMTWVVKEAGSPGELEVLLNLLASEGYEVWTITDRLTSYVVIAYDEESDEE